MNFGFFVRAGSENPFFSYLTGPSGFVPQLKAAAINGNFGNDVVIICVDFYVSGKFPIKMPLEPSKGRYSKKERSFAFKYPIDGSGFFIKTDRERREAIVEAWEWALRHSRDYSIKHHLDVNMRGVIRVFEEVSNRWMRNDLAS